jgi:hypothetical protein
MGREAIRGLVRRELEEMNSAGGDVCGRRSNAGVPLFRQIRLHVDPEIVPFVGWSISKVAFTCHLAKLQRPRFVRGRVLAPEPLVAGVLVLPVASGARGVGARGLFMSAAEFSECILLAVVGMIMATSFSRRSFSF